MQVCRCASVPVCPCASVPVCQCASACVGTSLSERRGGDQGLALCGSETHLHLLLGGVGFLRHEHKAVEHGARHAALVAKLVPVEGLLVRKLEEKPSEQLAHITTRVARVFTLLQREAEPAELVLSLLGLALVNVLDAQRTLLLCLALGRQSHLFAEALLTVRVDETHACILGRPEDLDLAGECRRLPSAHAEEEVLQRHRERAADELLVVGRDLECVALECHWRRVGDEGHRETALDLTLGFIALAHGLEPGLGGGDLVSERHRGRLALKYHFKRAVAVVSLDFAHDVRLLVDAGQRLDNHAHLETIAAIAPDQPAAKLAVLLILRLLND